jgi:hypothetical protein
LSPEDLGFGVHYRPDIFRFVTVNISRCGGPKLIEGELQSYIAQYIVKP